MSSELSTEISQLLPHLTVETVTLNRPNTKFVSTIKELSKQMKAFK